MQAILISSKDSELGRVEAQKIFSELKIDKFEITLFEYEKAIGIGNIREIQKKIYLKPVRSKIKGILIDAMTGITTEAQNALLKTLEETPEDTIVILQVVNADEALPTIVSRCKVIQINSKRENVDVGKHIGILNSNDRIGEKLKLAQDLSKDKNEALDFLENLIYEERKKLLSSHSNEMYYHSDRIKSVQKFHTIIKTTNVNLRLALENLFLNI